MKGLSDREHSRSPTYRPWWFVLGLPPASALVAAGIVYLRDGTTTDLVVARVITLVLISVTWVALVVGGRVTWRRDPDR